jgi:hypothetical protein
MIFRSPTRSTNSSPTWSSSRRRVRIAGDHFRPLERLASRHTARRRLRVRHRSI